MYGKKYLFLIFTVILLVPLFSFLPQNINASLPQIGFDTANSEIKNLNYIAANGTHITSPYKLTQNSTTVTVETREGSYVFNSNTCSLSTFASGIINGTQPLIKSDSYQVLASNTNNGTTNWNPVGVINNAQCNISVQSNATSVSITGTKSVTGAGTFSVTYTKTATKPLKITFSATNNNPAWTNYHIGLRETLAAPQFVTMGSTTYDLSQYNNTGLNRAWIDSHNAQVIGMYSNLAYSMGVGWNHVNQMTVHWINGKATLDIDFTYNTPILSPGHTITIDPSITVDTGSCNTLAGGVSSTLSFTVSSHTNRMLVVSASEGSALATTASYNGVSMTSIGKQADGLGGQEELFYLAAPSTGTHDILLGSAAQALQICAASYYNVKQTSAFGTPTGSGVNSGTYTKSVTTGTANSWVIAGTFVDYSTPPTGGVTANAPTIGDGVAADHVSAIGHVPTTAAGSYTASFTTSGGTNINAALQVVEMLRSLFTPPSTPTISKFNTINNTAINGSWNSPTGATWFWANVTLSGGATTHINTTNTYLLLNNYTAGSKYTLAVMAGNGSGTSGTSITKYNYTKQIAPTSLTTSSITATTARIGWTNPSGNATGGFKVYTVTGLGTNYTLTATTNNSTNHRDLSGLQGNREYTVKLSSGYAIGTNYTGYSANSTTVSFYTKPSPPTGLSISQTRPLIAHLSWAAPVDNGTINGYFIERSLNNVTWSTRVANTGNTTTAYNDTVANAGKYYYRVSTLQYAGTSVPSNISSRVIWNYFTVNAYHRDNSTAVYGSVFQSNSTSSNNQFTLISGSTTISGISQLNNFSAKNALINFVVGKSYNYNATANHSINMTTNDFDVDCSSTGTGKDIELWTNETTGHRISTFTTPTCFANNTVKWITKFTANGNNPNSFTTNVYVKILNATFLNNATLKFNNTSVTTALTSPYIVSAATNVGTGLQTKLFNWSMNLTVSPAYTPANYTVGHISISGTNKVTAPITFTTTPINSSLTRVTVTFPSTYTMAYQAKLNTEQQVLNYSGISVTPDTPSLGLSQSTFNIKNPKNDTVSLFAYDTLTANNATLQLNVPVTSVPFVSQIAQFKAGAFGTTAQFGSLDLVTFIVIIIAFIGMNRVNETIGVMLCVMIIAVMSYFGLIAWPTTMVAAVALVVLITVTSTRKLPWS